MILLKTDLEKNKTSAGRKIPMAYVGIRRDFPCKNKTTYEFWVKEPPVIQKPFLQTKSATAIVST